MTLKPCSSIGYATKHTSDKSEIRNLKSKIRIDFNAQFASIEQKLKS
jgi:hypothetical protein